MTTRLLTATVLAAGLAIAVPARAQVPGDWGQQDAGTTDVRRQAYDTGYRDGLSYGDRDARDNRRHDPDDIRDYRDADNGYEHRYGSKDDYRRSYRQGFEQGYHEALYGNRGRAIPRDRGAYRSGYPESDRDYRGDRDDSRRPEYGRSPNAGYGYGRYGYSSVASDKGFSDGYAKGLDDGKDDDRFDPVRQKWYREGDRGYSSRYGSRDAYKIAYRAAFRQGYEQGYRDGSRGYRTNRGTHWPF